MSPSPESDPSPPTWRNRLEYLRHYLRENLWKPEEVENGRPQAIWMLVLRTLSVTISGVRDNGLLSRAAALSYYSLIAMGPLLWIAVMVSGFIVRGQEEDLVVGSLNRLVHFLAPPVAEWDKLENGQTGIVTEEGSFSNGSGSQGTIANGTVTDSPLTAESVMNGNASLQTDPSAASDVVNTELVSLLQNIINSTQSGAIGVFGALILALIAIQLLTSIEQSMNQVWGVRRGRGWGERVVFYWTFITLGALASVGAIGLLSATTIANMFDLLPYGGYLYGFFNELAPFLSFLLITLILVAFYLFFPNTRVHLMPALIGAVVAAFLLYLNNVASVFYVHRVISQRSLYGSLGIVPILMLGMYVFWLIVLTGGQLAYAAQNARFMARQRTWENTSERARKTLALGTFLFLARRFVGGQTAPTADEIGNHLRAPSHAVHSALNRLGDCGWVKPFEEATASGDGVNRYLPAKPLHRVTLEDLVEALEVLGNNEGEALALKADPLLPAWRQRESEESRDSGTPLSQLLQGEDPAAQI